MKANKTYQRIRFKLANFMVKVMERGMKIVFKDSIVKANKDYKECTHEWHIIGRYGARKGRHHHVETHYQCKHCKRYKKLLNHY